jgi:translation initiation factor 3 subunit H
MSSRERNDSARSEGERDYDYSRAGRPRESSVAESFPEEDAEYAEYEGGSQVVQLDGLVLLKIIKHCKENVPEVVTGQLLGLNIEDRLEVTNCFPFASIDDNTEDDDYQIEMMKCMRAVNVDNNTVGWYQSAYLGSFINSSIVEAQYTYQKEIPSSVVVVYDPFRTTAGRLAVKAYRLADRFMKLWQGRDFSQRAFAKFDVSAGEILEEVPIKVHNSHLVHAFLYELREEKSMNCDFDRLKLVANPFVEKNLGILADCIDEYSSEQAKFQYHQRVVARQKASQQAFLNRQKDERARREAEGLEALPEADLSKNPLFKDNKQPSRMETYLVSNQIAHYCEQINASANQALQKLYVVESLIQSNNDAAAQEQ